MSTTLLKESTTNDEEDISLAKKPRAGSPAGGETSVEEKVSLTSGQGCADECCDMTVIIEAILFLSGEGISVDYLAEKLEISKKEVEESLAKLTKKYSCECGIHLIKYRNKYQFATNPGYAERVASVLNPIREKNLTRAALETLAIIAYKQPMTRIDVDAIRGHDSSYGIQILLDNNLIEVVGRKDAVGKPLLYSTTDEFLKRFDLEDIDKLPSYEELLAKIKVIHTSDSILGD